MSLYFGGKERNLNIHFLIKIGFERRHAFLLINFTKYIGLCVSLSPEIRGQKPHDFYSWSVDTKPLELLARNST